MAEEKKTPIDETGYINTEELRDVLKEKEKVSQTIISPRSASQCNATLTKSEHV